MVNFIKILDIAIFVYLVERSSNLVLKFPFYGFCTGVTTHGANLYLASFLDELCGERSIPLYLPNVHEEKDNQNRANLSMISPKT